MFGIFKKKDSDKDEVRAAIRQEFGEIVAVVRVAPLSKQARVGKGINDALSAVDQEHTKKSLQDLTFPELQAFLGILAKRQEELRLKEGDVGIEHLGYSLVSRWVMAVAMGDGELVKHFDDNMLYFKRAAQTLDGITATEADEAVTGLEKLRSLALQGDSSAQLELAIIYAEGNGVIRDDAEALRLFRLAADKGNAAAQSYVGMFYSEGDRVTKDDAEGVRWFRLAANQGASDAQFALSAMYFAGRGVPRDRITALMWMNIAEANGNEAVAAHRDSFEQPMTPEEISEATRRAKLCMASGYSDYTQDDTLEGSVQDIFISTQTHGAASEQDTPQPSVGQGDNAAQRLINSVKQKTDMIADRYPPSHDGPPDTNEIIINDAMRALAEMKELFKEANEAKTLCNQISELEPVSTKPMIELFISQVEDNFQAVMLNSLQVQTKIIDAINRMVLLNSNVPDGEGKEAMKDFVANLTVSANKIGKLHAGMADVMENVVVPAMKRAKDLYKRSST